MQQIPKLALVESFVRDRQVFLPPIVGCLDSSRTAHEGKQKPARKAHAKVAARLLSTSQAAEYLGISEWKLRNLVHEGVMPVVRGKYWRFDVKDLETYIQNEKERLL